MGHPANRFGSWFGMNTKVNYWVQLLALYIQMYVVIGSILSVVQVIFLGCLWRQCPIKKNVATLTLQHKEKMVEETPRRLCISYSSFVGSNFCSKGTGHFRLSGKQIWKSIWTNTKLLQGVIGPISAPNYYLNTVFNDVVSLCKSYRNSATPGSPWEKLLLVTILSLRVKSLSLQLKEEFAICKLG